MSTILSHEKRFVFFHLYKTAGTSITSILSKYENLPRLHYVLRTLNIYVPIFNGTTLDHHALPRHFENKLYFQDYFTFAIVRNPWDWQVSLFAFITQNRKHPQHRLISGMSFPEYIRWRCDNNVELQSDLLACSDGKIRLDFIGHFERLAADFAIVAESLGISDRLPHLKKSKRGDYREYYDDHTVALVAAAYQRDLEAFGYEF